MTQTVVLVDYGSGNLRSAERAVARVIDAFGLDMKATISAHPDIVAKADRLILPGVGAFGDCANGIRAIDGLWDAVDAHVRQRALPFLGICVGMQLMLQQGLEHGTHTGFGWIDGRVTAIREQGVTGDLKVPHMGWNELHMGSGQSHPVLQNLGENHAYFVHSYAAECAHPGDVLATVSYGVPLVAVVGRDTMIGTQFHPEKSQTLGLALIKQFLEWSP